MNMLKWRVRKEVQPRSKNGSPAHSTIGAARTSWTHGEMARLSSRKPNRSPPMLMTSRGMARMPATHRRRVKSMSSGLGASFCDGASGSSAMPQIGQVPGPGCRISGCMGQVQIVPSAPFGGAGAGTGG